MLMIRTPALLLMSCLASGQAYAAYPASPPDMAGVWEGTLRASKG
jgi:hypothetical protein